MEGRGRKSAASLSVISGGVIQRIEPPAGLTDSQAGLWRSIMATKPACWWTADNAPLLAEYVRAVDMGNLLAFQIEALLAGGDPVETAAHLKCLLDMRDKESRRAMSLATKMRLSQQSSYTDKSADTAKRRSGGAVKPWHNVIDQ